MIREEFFPTSVFGKDIKLDNDKLFSTTTLLDWSNQDPGTYKKTNYKNGWHSTTDMASTVRV